MKCWRESAGIFRHPAILRVSPAAKLAYLVSRAYLVDNNIPDTELQDRDVEHVFFLCGILLSHAEDVKKELFAFELWSPFMGEECGIISVHDFNPVCDAISEVRSAAGKRGAEARWAKK
jgi:hypothetical protein